jgi:hypothetical protein
MPLVTNKKNNLEVFGIGLRRNVISGAPGADRPHGNFTDNLA